MVVQRSIDAHDVDSFAGPMLDEEEIRRLSYVSTSPKRKGFVAPEKLAKNWLIGLKAAKRTVAASTQRAVRDFSHTTGGRRLKPNAWVLGKKRLHCDVWTDTLIAKTKSIRGFNYCQVYVTPFHFMFARPITLKSEAHLTLTDFFQEVGIPRTMIPDNAKELTQSLFRKKCNRAQCRIRPIEAYTPNDNITESPGSEKQRGS